MLRADTQVLYTKQTDDLDAVVNLDCMKLFRELYDLEVLYVPVLYKNPEKPLCIDLLLISRPKHF